jgi:hypothetical protein
VSGRAGPIRVAHGGWPSVRAATSP